MATLIPAQVTPLVLLAIRPAPLARLLRLLASPAEPLTCESSSRLHASVCSAMWTLA